MANVIVNEKLYDVNYLKQFTDMPMLVRIDNGKFLRESDIVSDGETGNFYFWDEEQKRLYLPRVRSAVRTGHWNSAL